MYTPDRTQQHIRPFDAIMLDVGDGHWLYVEQVGREDGQPVIFLHGGPGSGAQHSHRILFDETRHRAILFDQRGAGRSHPYLSMHANTTQHLVEDIERIRTFFGIQKWIVVGGSWGSTLALAYAEAYPERVSGLLLRAVFLGTRDEIDWAFARCPREIRPDLWAEFKAWLPPDEQAEPVAAYVARLTNPDPAIHAPAAHIWNAYERILSQLVPERTNLPPLVDMTSRIPPTPLVEAHYIKHEFFMPDGALIANAHRLAGIPGVIVQGRYDLLCPPANAYSLAKHWSACELRIMDEAGHAMAEQGVLENMRVALGELTRKAALSG